MPRELWKGAVRFGLVHIEVAYEDIVKGYEWKDGHFDSPYYLAPGKHGDKGYALLREVLARTGEAAIANVVIRTRQHIAVLYLRDDVLVLNTLRYANELRPAKELDVPQVKASTGKRAPREAEVIDFAALLEKSLASRRKGAAAANDEDAAPRKKAAAKMRRKPAAKGGAASHRRIA